PPRKRPPGAHRRRPPHRADDARRHLIARQCHFTRNRPVLRAAFSPHRYNPRMLTIRNVEKAFDGESVLHSITLEIEAGEVVALLGPSGSGKTTLLRIIAGLTAPDSGELLLDGEDLSAIPVHERGFGMVFQDYALFPHKNVIENVAFGLR